LCISCCIALFYCYLPFKFKFQIQIQIYLNAILFLPLFLVGLGPLSLFLFSSLFSSLRPKPSRPFLFPLSPHGPAQLAFFLSLLFPRAAQPRSFFLPPPCSLLLFPPAPVRPRASSLFPSPSLADRRTPPIGVVPDLEPDSGSSPSPATARHGRSAVRRSGPHAKARGCPI
jgi:hypothetical protein